MKFTKILSTLILVAVILFASASFVGCKDKENKKSSNSIEGVVSNGGTAVQKDGTLYYINGTEDSTNVNDYGKVTDSAIYKVAVDSDGNKTGKSSIFVSSIAGFENGSIYIFGDYLYYATPCVSKDNKGNVMNGYTTFWRIGLNGKNRKKIYTTKTENGDFQYSYYRSGEKSLFLIVYEEEKEKIYSVDIGTNPKTKCIVEKPISVLFSENGGNGNADNYIYYTMNPEKDSKVQTGNVVFRIDPNGKNETKISTGKTIELITIRNGALIYTSTTLNSLVINSGNVSTSTNTYSTKTVNKLNPATDDVLSYVKMSTYSNSLYFDNKIIVQESANNGIYQITCSNGAVASYKICTAEDAKFVAVTNEKLIYTKSNVLYAVSLTEGSTAVKLCETTCADALGLISADVVGDKLYFMNTKNTDEIEKTSIYSISINLTETGTAIQMGD